MSKFKVGDRVRYNDPHHESEIPKGYIFTVRCVSSFGKTVYLSNLDEKPAGRIGNSCECGKHHWVSSESKLELVEDKAYIKLKEVIIEEQITIMKDVQMFVKNLALSKDERALREVGLKTDCGVYTQDAIDIILQDMCKEKECRLIEIAHGVLKEKK